MGSFVQKGHVVLEANENYQKGSFRNKCQIGTAQGPLILSIPLRRGKHQAQEIKKVLISNELDWQTQHWRSIKTAYSNTPYYEHYDYLFEAIYNQKIELLWDFNIQLLDIVQKCIGSDIRFELSSSFQKKYNSDCIDFRNVKRPSQVIPTYPQVHEETFPFQSDLSVLDLIFHLGPEALGYLKNC